MAERELSERSVSQLDEQNRIIRELRNTATALETENSVLKSRMTRLEAAGAVIVPVVAFSSTVWFHAFSC